MSLLDFVLENQIIVISIAAALIPLLLAFVYIVVRRVRSMLKKRARRKAEAAQQAVLLAQVQVAEAVARKEQLAAAKAQAVVDAAALAAPGQPVAPSAETSEESETEETEGDEDEKEEEDETSDKMQDLLASVFVDEEAEAHMAVLLRGAHNPDIHDLIQLSQSVAAQLRARANG